MGILTKVLGLKVARKVVSHLEARSAAKDAQYIAAERRAPAPRGRANAMLHKAGGLYHRNPKLVASVATVVLAGVAAALAKKRGMY